MTFGTQTWSGIAAPSFHSLLLLMAQYISFCMPLPNKKNDDAGEPHFVLLLSLSVWICHLAPFLRYENFIAFKQTAAVAQQLDVTLSVFQQKDIRCVPVGTFGRKLMCLTHITACNFQLRSINSIWAFVASAQLFIDAMQYVIFQFGDRDNMSSMASVQCVCVC